MTIDYTINYTVYSSICVITRKVVELNFDKIG